MAEGTQARRQAHATGTLGRINEFDEETESFDAYAGRLKLYFVTNNVPEEKKSAYFCLLMGPKAFLNLTNLTVPDDAAQHTFKEIEEILMNYYCPEKFQIVE